MSAESCTRGGLANLIVESRALATGRTATDSRIWGELQSEIASRRLVQIPKMEIIKPH